MKGLLIIAHGSRMQSSNEEVVILAERIRTRSQLNVDEVTVAYLEMAEPSIAQAMHASFARGVTTLDILPYFLCAGRHVITDVPEEVANAHKSHPEVTVNILPYIGASEGIIPLIEKTHIDAQTT